MMETQAGSWVYAESENLCKKIPVCRFTAGKLPMRISVVYRVLGIGIVAVVVLAVTLIIFLMPDVRPDDVLAAYQEQVNYSDLAILYPLNETLFPPDIAASTFRWKDDNSESDTWLVTISFQDNKPRMNFVTSKLQWMPKAKEWEIIKKRSVEKEAEVVVIGVDRSARQAESLLVHRKTRSAHPCFTAKWTCLLLMPSKTPRAYAGALELSLPRGSRPLFSRNYRSVGTATHLQKMPVFSLWMWITQIVKAHTLFHRSRKKWFWPPAIS